ncbi:MAG: uracil-DNA glycosylase family protein [Paludibacteraceae bacterium]|nr:uracil-DNA glycosylase family protein [Paludibacteraceae bacterium]
MAEAQYTYPDIERHPLQPFLPPDAQILMLGSFPPPKERWCMDFFYPNPQNDMWRIMGQIFFGDKTFFEGQRDFLKGPSDKVPSTKANKKVFNREEIVAFCQAKGIAIFDTAQAVIRLQGNAADEHLEIVEQTDIAALLLQIPSCHNLCCTGGKAAQTLAEILHCATPKVGEYTETDFAGRTIRFWRMPSSSRAYPLSLEKKTAAYRRMFEAIHLL